MSSHLKFEKRVRIFLMFFLFVAFLIFIFGFIYKTLHDTQNDFPTFSNSFDPYYYSIVTMFTVGFGDHAPKKVAGKIFSCVQIILFWISVFMFNIYSVSFIK